MTTGEKIKARRIQLGFSIDRLANACGVNKSTISRWENDKTDRINLGMLVLLAKALYVEPFDLLNDDTTKSGVEPNLLDNIISKIYTLSEEQLTKLNELLNLMF